MKRVETITHPPKVNLEDAIVRYPEEARFIIRQWHAGLVDLNKDFYYVDDLDDCEIFTNFYRVTGASFRDTIPTYTQEVDGKPLTMADVYEQRQRVEDATKHLR